MSEFSERLQQLKLVIDETVEFPSSYLFKFIVPMGQLEEVLVILSEMEIEKKASMNGNYISVSGKKTMNSSQEIIVIYQKASVIKGIISL
jgi:putative lipoic acid-binding regulatory protein